MNSTPVSPGENLPLASQGDSRRHYNTHSETHDQVDGDQEVIAHVTRRGARLLSSSWSESQLVRKARLVFVFAALAQMVIIVLMQGLIYRDGGRGEVMQEYRHCLPDPLQIAINCSEQAGLNVTIPSFGKDKPVYVGFIIALTMYNAILCIYSLFGKHFLEIISFLIVNVLTMVYTCFEAWQFRPFGEKCSDLPIACWLAIGTVVVLSIFTAVFGLLVVCMYPDFRKKVEIDVNHDSQISKYYQWYEAVSSGVKLLILFTVVFSVAQLTLLLDADNYEFELTIILVVVAILAYFVLQLTIHYNSFYGYLAIACAGVLLLGYYIFKIIRFAAKNCPVCIDQLNALKNEYKALELLLETCTHNNNATLDAETDRSIQFENLAIFASANAITTIIVFVIYFRFWCSLPGDRLVDHFQANPSWIVRIMSYRRAGNKPLYVQIQEAKIKDVISVASNYCMRIKMAIAEAFGC